MFLAAQLVSIITIITTTIGLFLKDKFKVMIWLTLTNISLLVVYFLLGRYLGCLLVGGATLRTFIYFLYARFNKKPQLVFVIAFEIYFIALSLFLWKDYSDLFMLANLCLLTYTSWQNNMSVFRIGYIFSNVFLITYDVFVGAYMDVISELIMLVSTVWALVKYDYINKIHDVVLHFYSTISPAYETEISEKDGMCYVVSQKVKDEFNNFCYIKNPENVVQNLPDIKNYFSNIGRKPAVYLQPANQEEVNHIIQQMKGYKLLFHDCWMQLRTGYQVKEKKCLVKDVIFRQATPQDAEDFLYVFDAGFISCSGNVYKYSKDYYESYKKTFADNKCEEFNLTPYIAYSDNQPIGVLAVYANGTNAYICQVTTMENHRRQGVASNLMSFCIKDQRNKGIENFFIVTEKYTYLETFYMKNNFEEISMGFCYDVSRKVKKNTN